MIFGTIEINTGVLHTHNDSYTLTPGTNISAKRPFLGTGMIIAILILSFAISFEDILFSLELWIMAGIAAACVFTGMSLAQLIIINRDLRGSDLTVAAWGSYRHLNSIRKQVAEAINPSHTATKNERVKP